LKRSLFLFLAIFISCSLLFAGCGGDTTPPPGKVTTYFHIQNQFLAPIPGVSFTYTDPSNQTCTSPQTDSAGNMTVITTKVGIYSCSSIQYGSMNFTVNPPLQFYDSQDNIDNNATSSYTITINTSTGAISVIQNY